MTTATVESIAADNALVINPAHLGITASGPDLVQLFLEFRARHGKTNWKFELSSAGEFIFTPPQGHPFGLHLTALADDLTRWAEQAGGVVTRIETG